MKYRIKPNPRLKGMVRKFIWRRIYGSDKLPLDWKRCSTTVTDRELHGIMTRLYDARREGYSA